jgi:hypothetical protein
MSPRDARHFLEKKQKSKVNMSKAGSFTMFAFGCFRITLLRLSWRG